MRAAHFIPGDILKPYIRSITVYESDSTQPYTVLPGTGLVIGFQYKGRLLHVENSSEKTLSISGVTGLHDAAKKFRSKGDVGSVIVYFKQAGASSFFKQPLHELFRESISLDNFMLRSELMVIEEQLQSALSDEKRVQAVEDFLINRIGQHVPDPLVTGALSLIHNSKGNIRITELVRQLHTSQSPLEKKFRSAVGISPKKFASIVRLKHTINQYQSGNSLTKLGYEAGFYDQAHFIKEFKTFAGQAPETFFSGYTPE